MTIINPNATIFDDLRFRRNYRTANERLNTCYNQLYRLRDRDYWTWKNKADNIQRLLLSPSITNITTGIDLCFQTLGKTGSIKDTLGINTYRSGNHTYSTNEIKDDTDYLNECFILLAQMAKESRKARNLWRVREEATLAEKSNWYMIMDTLTVDESKVNDTKKLLSSSGWRVYKQRWREIVRKSAGYSRKDKQIEYWRYFGVVEFGKNGNNPHIHVLHFCKNIPNSWKHCPNLGRKFATRREINHAKSTWDYGFSTPVAVRTGSNDPWSRLGWAIPVDKDGKTIKLKGAQGAASYIAKYLDKTEDRQWITRTRMSRNLGLTRIKPILTKIKPQNLKALMNLTTSDNYSQKFLTMTGIPPKLIAVITKSLRISKAWDTKPKLCARLLRKKQTTNLSQILLNALAMSTTGDLPRFSISKEWLRKATKPKCNVYDELFTRAINDFCQYWEHITRKPISTQTGVSYAHL